MEKFDTVIVGGGLAGLTAAYILAKDGLSVLVIERGDYCGAKSMTGGRLYLNPVRNLMPGFWDSAPFERHVNKETISFLKEKTAVSIDLLSDRFNQQPYHSCTVLRAKFDQWLASRAEDAGAVIVTKNCAEDIIRKEGKVTGVRAGGDDVGADVVIIAEGANSILTEKLGLRRKSEPGNYAVGIKELIELPRNVIDERFGLSGDEGAAQLFVGSLTKGLRGGGFLYTNGGSISLGVVVGMESAMHAKLKTCELTEEFKSHPVVKNLIKGGKLLEYSAHIIPEGGLHGLSRLCGNGVIVTGDAAGFCLNLGIAVKGMDYAIVSGVMAARAVRRAREKGDFSADSLSCYKDYLEGSVALKDFRTFEHTPAFLENNRVYEYYPGLACDIMESVLSFDSGPKKRFSRAAIERLSKDYPLLEIYKMLYLLKDASGALRAL